MLMGMQARYVLLLSPSFLVPSLFFDYLPYSLPPLQQEYPTDERHWLMSTAYNTGVECLASV